MNEICFDDDGRDEVSVVLETLFIVVVSTLLSNVDVSVSIELEISFVVELN
jgi:hypothetical protein